MSRQEFEKILEKHENEVLVTNWQDRKEQWLRSVAEFYEAIELWLRPYIQEKRLSYKLKKISLTEAHVGTYDVDMMTLSFAWQNVKINPVGTLLPNLRGRIDMEGAYGIVEFSIAEEGEDTFGKWKIYTYDCHCKMVEKDFTDENFFDALVGILVP